VSGEEVWFVWYVVGCGFVDIGECIPGVEKLLVGVGVGCVGLRGCEWVLCMLCEVIVCVVCVWVEVGLMWLLLCVEEVGGGVVIVCVVDWCCLCCCCCLCVGGGDCVVGGDICFSPLGWWGGRCCCRPSECCLLGDCDGCGCCWEMCDVFAVLVGLLVMVGGCHMSGCVVVCAG